MKPYSRPTGRPFPNADRALHQLARGRLPQCPRCEHPVIAHARDDAGQRVCTRGQGLVTCRECAHVQAAMPDHVRAVFYLAECFKLAPRADSWRPFVLA